MTALSTVSAGIKPPTSIPQDTIWYNAGKTDIVAGRLGAESLLCTGGGVAVEELNVTGSGYLQLLCAGNDNPAVSMDAYRFEQGFTVDITTASNQCYLIYKYYLDS